MRFSLVLASALAGLTMTAAAQQHQKPKAKPSYSEEKSSKSQTRAVKEPANHSSSAQELRRVEQSSAKASAPRKAESSKAARTNPALKQQKKEANPSIHFASSGSSSKGSKSKGGDPYKGRMRHKGSHH